MRILVDTCVWSNFLRRNRSRADPIATEVERLIRRDLVQLIGPVRQELLSGTQPQEHFMKLREYLRFFPNLPLDEEDDENAAQYYNVCRQNGIRGTGTDLLICAVAVRHCLRIFTTDTDFDRYARHLPIDLHVSQGRRR